MQRNLATSENSIDQHLGVQLTDQRVVYQAEASGRAISQSLQLSQVEWTRVAREHKPILLVVAGMMVLPALFAFASKQDFPSSVIPLLVGLFFVGAYFATRKVMMTIGAGEGRIVVAIPGGAESASKAAQFLDKVDAQALAVRSYAPSESQGGELVELKAS